jgi:hypothetical protein
MNIPKTPKTVGRKAMREALDTVPLDSLFTPSVSKELTAKQKGFARDVAMGATKAQAYRNNYNVKSKNALHREPYQLTRDQRIANEIEAVRSAIEAEHLKSPAALRALVINALVGVITNPDSQPGQITAAAKVLGTVTEVAAFTERKEVRTITSSEDARAKIMQELKALTNAQAQDVETISEQADSLMAELEGAPGETHPTPTPQTVEAESHSTLHTIPHEQSPQKNLPNPDPTPLNMEDPPSPS